MRKSKIGCIFLCILCVLNLCAITLNVNAAEENNVLTLICRTEETTLVGMDWKIYHVGERQGEDFVLTGDFSQYEVNLSDLSEESITEAAKTLESYAIADKIPFVGQGKTDKNGELRFENLEAGLYLASGKILLVDNIYYVPSALLIEITDEGANFSYDAYPKFYYATLDDNVKSYTVKKVWEDNDNAFEKRPTYVTVELYCDEVLSDIVTLDESNNWEYSWVELSGDSEWRAIERDIPPGYEVIIDFNSTQFLIKNVYKKTTTTTTTTATTAVGTATTTNVTTSTQSTITSKPTLPQTGQLWWPVVPMSFCGMILLVGGFVLRIKRKADEE